ncbi:MAG: hypothetical protein E5Y06_12880 [Mesorhizobium sp.]|nr:MAG: hypothetical protein E5Y06_12880 [Mesorhizobium sp.]TJV00442.1 MAG: hypothetical protein E5Y08_03685 [Mesorhizobium sp.]TJV17679.1 MAG: hypothetical protein E5Y07_11345 [Mesorhizobium sp.]
MISRIESGAPGGRIARPEQNGNGQCLFSLLPLREKVAAKRSDEGCSRERQRLTPLEHPSSVSALRADPPSPTRGEGRA